MCTIKFAVSALARAAVLGSEYLNTIMFMNDGTAIAGSLAKGRGPRAGR